MNKLFWKKVFDESNLLIIIPAIFIVVSLVWFFIFGLAAPTTTSLYNSQSIVMSQQGYETRFLEEFSNDDYTADNPFFILDPYKIAPLSGLLMFNTDEAKIYKVIIKGKTVEADIEYITESLLVHRIPIYGLYPDTENTIELYEFNSIDTYNLVHIEYVNTKAIPSSIILPRLINTTYEYFGSDLMITMSSTSNLPVGYDSFGDVRWYLEKELSWSVDQLQNGHFLFGNRDLVNPYYTAELLEIDYLGKVYKQYNIPGGYHHDFYEMPSGNILVATNDFDGSLEDIIIEIDRLTGEIVKTIDIADYINPLEGTSEMWSLIDWFHLNSIFYDEPTDSLILSGKNQDIVISIGYTSNELNWVLGDPVNFDTTFSSEYFFSPQGVIFEWQYGQSSAVVLENGNIFLFDNGINKSKLRETDISVLSTYSRGVIYNIDTELMTIEQVFEYGKVLGSGFYSPDNSSIEFYGVDNYLIHSGGHITINGDLAKLPSPTIGEDDTVEFLSTTLEINASTEAYRMEIEDIIYQVRRVSIYDNVVNFEPSVGEVLGEQFATKKYEGSITSKVNLLVTVPEFNNLSFEKEFDRLVIDGTFNQGDSVYLVLENGHSTLHYLIPTVENSFVTLCFDECHDGTLDITYFVNEEGVSGEYNISIYINGKKYNSYKTVIFE